MKRYIKHLISHPLFSGSFIMIVGLNTTNFINYIYNLFLGRLLGPVSYGELAALLSLIGLFGMIPFSLGLAIIKFISASKNNQEISNLTKWFSKRLLILSLIIVLTISLMSPFLSSFLKISNISLIILISVSFLFSLPAFFNRAVLQGLLRFKDVVVSVFVENTAKLALGVILVSLGWSVFGAVVGYIAAVALGWFISRVMISDYFDGQKEHSIPEIKLLLLYCLPVLIQSLAMTSLYSTDLVLVKHFFSPHQAGIYASLSYLGRIIFFGAGPIGAVMFPMISQRKSKNEKYKKIYFYSFLATLAISVGVLVIYLLVPSLAINLLYGSLYLEASNLLIWFGIFMTLFTLASLIISFQLSLGRTRIVIFPVAAAILQVIGINLFHNNLISVITVSIISSLLLLLSVSLFEFAANMVLINED